MYLDKLIMTGEAMLTWDFGEVFHGLAKHFLERAVVKKEKALRQLGFGMISGT